MIFVEALVLAFRLHLHPNPSLQLSPNHLFADARPRSFPQEQILHPLHTLARVNPPPKDRFYGACDTLKEKRRTRKGKRKGPGNLKVLNPG
ncbi:hypothetical protein BofuT4_uP123940.1 [Botrytis cinerea T4]|uniref:Uncharacterized protein n=1 Tax=Botryotinia fuckeliana (strain T4) TaxID=999810 RepID=G2YRU8_BOTF4|nr:hypothetical protein BofuT4_uP123940.1 [Botrytis cinerea T4]